MDNFVQSIHGNMLFSHVWKTGSTEVEIRVQRSREAYEGAAILSGEITVIGQ